MLAADVLHKDIITINKWATEWLVNFNPNKTKDMIISKKINKPIHPSLFMDGVILPLTSEHKHLGLTFCSDGTWSCHISNTVKKGWQRLSVIRNLKFIMDRKSLEKIYFSFVRPILEYGDFVWDNCTNEDKNKIESIQIEAMRIVTGATKFVNIEKLYAETGWVKLEDRRYEHKMCKMYGIVNNHCPSYLSNLLSPRNEQPYNLREQSSIRCPRCRTNLYNNSFVPSAIRAWNSLPNEVKNSPTLGQFKRKIRANLTKPPTYYFVCKNRSSQIQHTRLRLNCSTLNDTLVRKNISNNPYCQCGDTETIEHFFLKCPLYQTLRQRHIFFTTI